MAFNKISVNKNEWTLIGESVSTITFQNVGQYPVFVNFTSGNTAPTDEVGLVYGYREGELKKTLADMTEITTPDHVWAKSVSYTGSVIVEQ